MGSFVKPPKIIVLLGKQVLKTCDHTMNAKIPGYKPGIFNVCYSLAVLGQPPQPLPAAAVEQAGLVADFE